MVTLDQLLGLVVDAERRVEIAIETKHPTRYAGLVERGSGRRPPAVRLGGCRAATGPPPVFVMSFSWIGLRRVRALAPRIPTVLLLDRVPLRMRDGSLPIGVTVAGPSIEIVRTHPAYVERVHRQGPRVFVVDGQRLHATSTAASMPGST